MLKYVAPLEQRLRHLQLPALPARTHPTAVTHRTDAPTTGQLLAEHTAAFLGSWRFIGIQAGLMALWVLWNAVGPLILRYDQFPYVFLNLAMSAEAAFTGPILLIAANVGAIRDHAQYDRIEQLVAQNERLEETVERLEGEHGTTLADIRALLREHTALLCELLPERRTMVLPVVPPDAAAAEEPTPLPVPTPTRRATRARKTAEVATS